MSKIIAVLVAWYNYQIFMSKMSRMNIVVYLYTMIVYKFKEKFLPLDENGFVWGEAKKWDMYNDICDDVVGDNEELMF